MRLAEDLLTLARTDDGRMELRVERHDVRELLEAVAGRNGARARTSTGRSRSRRRSAQTVAGDRIRLEQALGNLVDNALRHGSGTVRLDARIEDGRVDLSVSDEGAGFPPAFLPHAFERFSRAEASRAGTEPGSASRSSTRGSCARRECSRDELRGRRRQGHARRAAR